MFVPAAAGPFTPRDTRPRGVSRGDVNTHTAERLFRTHTVPAVRMSENTRQSVFGAQTGPGWLLYTALALGTLCVAVVDGGSHWFVAAVAISVLGVADRYSASERQRQRLSFAGLAAVLAVSLVVDFGLLP